MTATPRVRLLLLFAFELAADSSARRARLSIGRGLEERDA